MAKIDDPDNIVIFIESKIGVRLKEQRHQNRGQKDDHRPAKP